MVSPTRGVGVGVGVGVGLGGFALRKGLWSFSITQSNFVFEYVRNKQTKTNKQTNNQSNKGIAHSVS